MPPPQLVGVIFFLLKQGNKVEVLNRLLDEAETMEFVIGK